MDLNGYPKALINMNKTKAVRNDVDSQKTEYQGTSTLPYVQGVTERIQRILQSYEIRSSVKPFITLKQELSRPKDVLPKETSRGVVYEISCGDCDVKYI